jgi:hypothetical protein
MVAKISSWGSQAHHVHACMHAWSAQQLSEDGSLTPTHAFHFFSLTDMTASAYYNNALHHTMALHWIPQSEVLNDSMGSNCLAAEHCTSVTSAFAPVATSGGST